MNNVLRIKEAKKKDQNVKKPQVTILSTEDRIRLFANIVIDRILEEQTRGNLKNLIKNKEG